MDLEGVVEMSDASGGHVPELSPCSIDEDDYVRVSKTQKIYALTHADAIWQCRDWSCMESHTVEREGLYTQSFFHCTVLPGYAGLLSR